MTQSLLQPAKSLQARLLSMVLGLAALVWFSAAVLTWVDTQHELDELLDGHLAQAAALLVVQQAGADDDDHELVDAPSLHKYAPKVAFQVFHDGQLMTRSANAGQQPMATQLAGFSTVRMPDGEQWRVFAAQGAETDVQVFVGEKVESRDAILRAVLRSVFWPLLIALPLLAAAGWWSVRKGLEPVRRLSAELGRREPQALEPLTLEDMPVELEPLVDSLNAMLQRIDHMVVAERRFTADAAHELRTPIAAIRAQAQVALGAGDDVVERRHALQATLAGCDRATRLVEQLLTLARLEANPAVSTVPVDLAAVVQRIAADLAPAALAKSQILELDAQTGCALAVDEVLLGVLVRNLVDNASRYSPPGAQIHVQVSQSSEGPVLRVQDSGPGLSEEALQRLGERFFRVLGSDQPGSGLGWSIVRRLLDVFRARVQIEASTQWGGLSVTVTWPNSV